MIRYLKIVICFIFITSFVGEVLSIKCWTCSSELEPRCGDPFENSTLQIINCDHAQGLSVDNNPKVCHTIKRKVNGVWSYSRGCGFARDLLLDEETPCAVQTTSSLYQEYCPCSDRDLCNNST